MTTESQTALVVDLDGTLIKTDMLIEDFLGTLWLGWGHWVSCFKNLKNGRERLKSYLAGIHTPDYALLPYNEAVIHSIQEAKKSGRKIYLATASNEKHAKGVCDHLGLFDGYFASDDSVNLKSGNKAEKLSQEFGAGNFDYIGNARDDLAIWKTARRAIAVSKDKGLLAQLRHIAPDFETIETPPASIKTYAKALRVHQWAKNALIFVPLVTSQSFTLPAFATSALAFVSFSLCASAIYILNDLADLNADRRHKTKCRRPFASGTLSITQGAVLFPALLAAAFITSSFLPLNFTVILFAYLALTTAYTFSIKRMMVADVITLSFLYTMRVWAGALAIDVFISEWLIAFSIFIFTALAFTKRHIELLSITDDNKPDPDNRDYKKSDTPIIASLSSASGFSAVIVFALYISSPHIRDMYQHPQVLWLICLVFIYWIARIMVLTQRRVLKDDPVLFAVKDKVSYACAVIIACILLAAS